MYFYFAVKNAIMEQLGPKAEVIFNHVPKAYAMSDIYCQLIPNDNEEDPYYQVMPRMGAMEVSVNGIVSKSSNLYVKLMDIIGYCLRMS